MSKRDLENVIESTSGEQERLVSPRATDHDRLSLRAGRRQKWLTKQARRQEREARERERMDWIEHHSHFCTHVSTEDVESVRGGSKGPLAYLLRPYLDLKDGPVPRENREKLFIAEGTETVRVLIRQLESSESQNRLPPIQVKSILVKPASLFDEPVYLLADVKKACTRPTQIMTEATQQQNDKPDQRGDCPPFHVLVGNDEALSAVAGFHIARGALACGVVPERDEAWLQQFLARKSKMRLLALDAISDTANMGSMIRCAAAFGVDTILLSHDCCDAWYRRSVRVSMGHIFHVPIVRVGNLASMLRHLAGMGVTSYAAVIDLDADLVLEGVARRSVPGKWCCVMGNEGNGISENIVQSCSYRIRINMVDGIDSLSVPVATGILLHGLRERESTDRAT